MRIAENVVRINLRRNRRASAQSQGSEVVSFVTAGCRRLPGVLRHFLVGAAYDIAVLDMVPDDGSIPGYKQGSA